MPSISGSTAPPEALVPLRSDQTAESTFTRVQLVIAGALILPFVIVLVLGGFTTFLLALTAIMTVLYAISFFFNLLVWIISDKGLITVTPEELEELSDEELPVYTLLFPMFKEGTKKYDRDGNLVYNGEAEVISPLMTNIKRLDYPHKKKELFFLLEENDPETIDAVMRQIPLHGLEDIATVIVIGKGYPQTKPRACNEGLKRAHGQYITIYDAEDNPEPDQLKKAIAVFRKSSPEVICVQARLAYRNPNTSWVTKLFTAEYETYFKLVLSGFSWLGIPVPLGGTSNHFERQKLLKSGGWDPFNVTEDTDLGVRIARSGYRVVVMESVTWEEAVTNIKAWRNQRSRWLKGRAQTFLVHTRNPFQLTRDLGPTGTIGFFLVIGAPVLMLLMNPVFWSLTILYAITQSSLIQELYPSPLLYAGVTSFLVGNFVCIMQVGTGCMVRRELRHLVGIVLLTVPFYWALMSVAMYKAAWQLVTRPHYWEKTQHGLDLTGVTHEEAVATSGGD